MRYVLLHATNDKYYIARHTNEVVHAEVTKAVAPKANYTAKDFTDQKFEGRNPWVLLNSQELIAYDEKTGTFDHMGTPNMLPMPDYVKGADDPAPSVDNISETAKAVQDGKDVDPAEASAAAAKAQDVADATSQNANREPAPAV